MIFESVNQAAQGRWHSILPMLGIDAEFLVNRHGPCPMCGGKDRFRFDDKHGEGLYYCNGCGAGNGFQMLEKFHNWDFNKAVDEVGAVVNCASEAVPKNRGGNPRAALRKALKGCDKDRLQVIEYLSGRGLTVFPSILRQHSSMPYSDEGRFIANYPAMLATIYSPESEALSVLRTYLDSNVKDRKKVMSPVKPIKGGAIRLFLEEGDVLAVAEGIETAIAAHELTVMKGTPMAVWSVISTAGMESFIPPKSAKRIVIFADNDKNFAGQKAAYTLAKKLALKGLEVKVNVPPAPGDWLDVLNNLRGKAA